MKKFEFEIGTQLIVVLKKTCYIELWQGTREVDLLSLNAVKQKFDCPKGPEMEKLKKENIVAVKCIIGRYVGSRNGQNNELKIIKIEPYFGLMHPDSEYLIIPPSYIKDINKYELKPNP
jgi:hypothetical protein